MSLNLRFGTSSNDTIEGSDGKDWIFASAGNDSVETGAGDDLIYGGEGNDYIDAGEGNDAVLGDAGSDTLNGGAGDDFLQGGSGNDVLTGGDGADTFLFETDHGDDVVTDFTNGEDIIDLSLFRDFTSFEDLTITADGNDAVIDLTGRGGGTIRLTDVAVNDLDASDFVFYDGRIQGDQHDNSLAGGMLDDTISGGFGRDTIDGGAGNDSITGGCSNDLLRGGDGDDVFVFGGGHGTDTISDFTDGEDIIDLRELTSITGLEDLRITEQWSHGEDGSQLSAVIDLTSVGGGTIWLEGVAVSEVDADDFLFHRSAIDDPPIDEL